MQRRMNRLTEDLLALASVESAYYKLTSNHAGIGISKDPSTRYLKGV